MNNLVKGRTQWGGGQSLDGVFKERGKEARKWTTDRNKSKDQNIFQPHSSMLWGQMSSTCFNQYQTMSNYPLKVWVSHGAKGKASLKQKFGWCWSFAHKDTEKEHSLLEPDIISWIKSTTFQTVVGRPQKVLKFFTLTDYLQIPLVSTKA